MFCTTNHVFYHCMVISTCVSNRGKVLNFHFPHRDDRTGIGVVGDRLPINDRHHITTCVWDWVFHTCRFLFRTRRIRYVVFKLRVLISPWIVHWMALDVPSSSSRIITGIVDTLCLILSYYVLMYYHSYHYHCSVITLFVYVSI